LPAIRSFQKQVVKMTEDTGTVEVHDVNESEAHERFPNGGGE